MRLAGRTLLSHLWLLKKVSFKSGGKIVVVEQSRNRHDPVATFLNPKPCSDFKCIFAGIEDLAINDPTRKAAPQSSEIPFAATDRCRGTFIRKWIMLHRNPKKPWCISIVNYTVTGTREYGGVARELSA
jgi:hypothetical protein